MKFPYNQHPKDDVKEPQMTAIPPLRQWVQSKGTQRDLKFLQKRFDVTPAKAFEMLMAWTTWADMEPAPYPDEPEEFDG